MARDYKYKLSKKNSVSIDGVTIVTNEKLEDAIKSCNAAIKELNDTTAKNEVNIFEVLQMRNISGLIGEYFAKCVLKFSDGNLQANLHQDGYPDLLLTKTDEQRDYYNSLYTVKGERKYPIDKVSFSPYKYGGIEVKATCGSTPPAKKVPKPLIGEQRIQLITRFDWKSHHRQTNNLLGIFWDFIDGIPVIAGCFYSDKLNETDWSKIVQPKRNDEKGGKGEEKVGRTTSVSIMQSCGIKKMCDGWLAIIDDNDYMEAFAKKNRIGYRVDKEGVEK